MIGKEEIQWFICERLIARFSQFYMVDYILGPSTTDVTETQRSQWVHRESKWQPESNILAGFYFDFRFRFFSSMPQRRSSF
jgi:hypothetical protein